MPLAARPIEGIAEKVSNRKPVINPVQDITPDGRPMEGITYPDHLAPGVSLDSGLKAGMSNWEPLPLSVHKTSLVARPQVETRTSHWQPVINPVRDINQNGLPMEGTTYSEHPALVVSPDSRLMNELLCPEPLQQSVLRALPATRTNETDKPKHPALALLLHHEQLCFQLAAWPMSVPDIVSHTDINDDINIDLPESSAPIIKSPSVHGWLCFSSSAWPTLKSEIAIQTDVNLDMKTDLPENSATMKSSQLMFVDWEDAVRREVLRGRSMEYRSSSEIHSQLLSPDDV